MNKTKIIKIFSAESPWYYPSDTAKKVEKQQSEWETNSNQAFEPVESEISTCTLVTEDSNTKAKVAYVVITLKVTYQPITFK